MPRSAHDMTTYNFNFGVQYQFPHEAVLSVAWVGSRGLRLTFSNNVPDLNQLSLQTLAQNQNSLLNMVPFPYANAITDPNAPWYGATQVPQWVMLQKYPQFPMASEIKAEAESSTGATPWETPSITRCK